MFNRLGHIQLNFELPQVLFRLFCLYAFLLPFELILEMWFGIDTIFKPFRIVNLLIIGVFALQLLRGGVRIRQDIREDMFLYAVFIYGLGISLFRMMTAPFQLSHFGNDLFQSGLYLLAFFIFKTLELTPREMIRIFWAFAAGMLMNSVYMLYTFVWLRMYGRDAGFMDNPNYAALGLVAAMSFFLLKLDVVKRFSRQLLTVAAILLLFYVFIITGSRAGLILLILAGMLIFFFVSFWKKVGLITASLVLGFMLLPRDTPRPELGGPLILVNRIMNKLDSEEEDVRFFIWRGVMRALEEEGYMGMGIGQFKANFSHYYQQETHSFIRRVVDRGYFLSTHNDYLAILTDYGVIGLAFYLIFFALSLRKKLMQLQQPAESREHRFLLRLSFVILSFMIIFGMAAENFQNQLFWFLLMFATSTSTPIHIIPE